MNSVILLATLALILAATGNTQTTFSTSCQVGSDVTTFPACNSFFNSGDACATVTDRPGKQKCLCKQPYLDSLYGCENELRLCLLANDLDDEFSTAASLWSSLCTSGAITFTPTAAATASFTPYPDDLCIEVKKDCVSAEALLTSCLAYTTDTDNSRFSSCTCQPEILRKDYTCGYIINQTCLGIGATLSNLEGYFGCDNFASVIGTLLPAANNPGPTTDLPTLPVTSTISPGSIRGTSPGSAPTSSKPSDVTRHDCDLIFLLGMFGFLIIFHAR